MPNVSSLEALNEKLLRHCVDEEQRTVDGQSESIGIMFTRELPHLLKLPERKFDSSTSRTCVIPDTYQTVIYESNRYSVPGKYAGRPLRVRAYMDVMVFSTATEVVAEHKRTYERNQYVLAAEHYLDQLERKPHALPYARPLL